MSQKSEGLNTDVFDQIIAESSQPKAAAPESSGAFRRFAGDGLVTAVKGAIGVPEAAVGLADIATGGRVGKFLENEGGAVGFRPKEAKAQLDTLYSPEQKAAFAAVQNAANPEDGMGQRVLDTGLAALRNPSTIVHAVGESIPSIGAGGVLARGAMAIAPKAAGWAAAGIGEGVVSAGATAEQIRQGTQDGLLTGEQSSLAAGSGALTMGLGIVAAKAAKSLGVGDIDTMLAGGSHVDPGLQKGFVKRLLEGAFTEGVMEELPQSVQEQVTQNYALGKPLDEGVDQAIVMGVLSGGAMGMGAQVIKPKVPEVGPLSRGANQAPPAAAVTPTGTSATAAPLAPDETQALLDHANARSTALKTKADGTKDQKTTSEDGKEVIASGEPGQFLTPQEKAESTFLQEAGGDAASLKRAYPNLPAPSREAEAQREADRPPEPMGKVEDGDILNSQGKPFTNMAAAMIKQKVAGPDTEIVRVAKGLVVRKKATDVSTNTALPAVDTNAAGRGATVPEASMVAGVGDTGAAEPAVDAGSVEPAPANGAVPLESVDAPAVDDIAKAMQEDGMAMDDGIDPKKWSAKVGNLGDVYAEITSKPGEPMKANIRAQYMGADQAGSTAEGLPAIRANIQKMKDGLGEFVRREVSKRQGKLDADAMTGKQIDSEWHAFTSESGTLGKPRSEMPQIKAAHRGAMVNFLNARGITHETGEVDPATLKPTQAEFSPAKVLKAAGFTETDRSILVSQDGHVLDGHHQWMAKLQSKEPVKVIRLGAPIAQLLDEIKEFPSAEVAAGANASGAIDPDTDEGASKQFSYPEAYPGAPAFESPAQHAVVDFMNGDIDKAQLTQKFADLGMTDGNVRSVTDRISEMGWTTGDRWNVQTLQGKQSQDNPSDDAPVMVSQPASPKKKSPARGARNAAYDKNPLLTFMATHGLFHDKDKPNSLKSEFSPDKAIMVPGYGVVFKKNGLTLDALTARAIEDGYLPKDGTESQLSELIRRAVRGEKIQPLYAEGVAEQVMEAAIAERQDFESHLTSEQELAADDNYDPFQSVSELGYELEDIETAGYSELDDPIKLEVNALLAQAEALGIDTEALKENAYEQTRNGSEQDYYEAARDAIQTAIAQGNRSSSKNDGQPGNAGSEAEGLTAPTRADVLKQQADAKAEAQRKEDGGDKPLPRRELTGDVPDMFNPQGSVFDAPAEPEPAKPAASGNTIFTDDMAAAARAILKKKLNGTLNSGLDPELMQAGITLAGYHIEKGARSFAAFAKAMLEDLGDAAKPYLKSWYLAAKFDPRAAKFDGMDGAAAVEAADIDAPGEDKRPKADVPEADGIIEHVTGKGKVLRGVVRTDLTQDQAVSLDRFTFKKDGGYFIREEHLAALNARHPLAPTAEKTGDIVARYPSVEGTEIHVIKTAKGYGVNLMDTDSGEYMPALRMYTGPDALEKATAYAKDIQKKADPPSKPTSKVEELPAEPDDSPPTAEELEALGDITITIQTESGPAKLTINAAKAMESLDKRADALEMVRKCLS